MAKKHRYLTDAMFAVSAKTKWSRQNSEYYCEIELIDANTGNLHKTYVGEDNINWEYWEKVMENLDLYPEMVFCIQGEFKTVRDTDLVNADSIFKIKGAFERQEFFETIEEQFYS